jgi:hypothetical protein
MADIVVSTTFQDMSETHGVAIDLVERVFDKVSERRLARRD